MGIVIRLLRHIPASLLLTYTDERNAKMFHGFARFVHSPVAKLACRGPNNLRLSTEISVLQALSATEARSMVQALESQAMELVFGE